VGPRPAFASKRGSRISWRSRVPYRRQPRSAAARARGWVPSEINCTAGVDSSSVGRGDGTEAHRDTAGQRTSEVGPRPASPASVLVVFRAVSASATRIRRQRAAQRRGLGPERDKIARPGGFVVGRSWRMAPRLIVIRWSTDEASGAQTPRRQQARSWSSRWSRERNLHVASNAQRSGGGLGLERDKIARPGRIRRRPIVEMAPRVHRDTAG